MANDQRIQNAKIIKKTMAHEIHELGLAIDKLEERKMVENLADMRRFAHILKIVKEAIADKLY